VHRLSRLVALCACVLGAWLTTSCADETAPTAPQAAFDHGKLVNSLGFARCDPLPYAFSSARIGPTGGSLKAGKNTLRIPPGALTQTVLISMESPSDTLNYVVFGPEGLTFDPASPPILTMTYRNCPSAAPKDQPLEIVYVDDELTAVLDTTQSLPADTVAMTVGGKLEHFSKYVLRSRYAVAF
jgi:hypothetical protein